MNSRLCAVLLLALTIGPATPVVWAGQGPATLYSRALARERTLRDSANKTSLKQVRAVVNAYDAIVRRHPRSGYCDNALWQAANLSLLAYERFGEDADRRTAVRLLTQLKQQYSSSSLLSRVDETLRQAQTVRASAVPARSAPHKAAASGTSPEKEPSAPVRVADTVAPLDAPKTDVSRAETPRPGASTVALRDIKRSTLPDGVRISMEMDAESGYHVERLENPRRVFFDLQGVRPIGPLQDATLKFPEDLVREIRLGRHPNMTRVVIDMEGADSYAVFTLYNPYRIVVDFKATTPPPASGTSTAASVPASPAAVPVPQPPQVPSLQPPAATGTDAVAAAATKPDKPDTTPIPSRPVTSGPLTPPAVPAANSDGKFSLARQLGLGISRIVIDAGHGGHDPGAQANGLKEAELVLDVAQRLSKLAQKQGIEVVMTRDSDIFIPLEERTAIANREGADLFLSIHANAARNVKARGVETYFLNFASNPDAEAVAARENSASGKTMHSLPEIVRAIALNNKLDESRDFADMVQRAMVRRLAARNRQLKDLGVKQAPFVVLIGAAMPSVLAEISFVTNKQEGQLLKTGAYRQHIAEALMDAVLRYQQSLKKMKAVGAKAGAY